jgi:hypothetical protein
MANTAHIKVGLSSYPDETSKNGEETGGPRVYPIWNVSEFAYLPVLNFWVANTVRHAKSQEWACSTLVYIYLRVANNNVLPPQFLKNSFLK